MTPVAGRLALAMVVLALGALGCGRRAPGSCREDVDCPAGFDCTAGACARRERLRFAGGGGTPAVPTEVSPPLQVVPRTVEVAPPVPPVVPEAKKKPRRVPSPEPPVLPPPSPAREAPLPAWKQRLKNT